jgi:hypothetical protein
MDFCMPLDPGRLARQVKEFGVANNSKGTRASSKPRELLHLPGKPAGIEERHALPNLAVELLHQPHKAAGVVKGYQTLPD